MNVHTLADLATGSFLVSVVVCVTLTNHIFSRLSVLVCYQSFNKLKLLNTLAEIECQSHWLFSDNSVAVNVFFKGPRNLLTEPETLKH